MPKRPLTMGATPYLTLQRVVAWQGPRPVLQGLDLQLNLGEHTVVLGPNGAGKSALIKLLSRELYPVVEPGSSLRLFGSSTVNLWELRRRMGLKHDWACSSVTSARRVSMDMRQSAS